MPDEATPTEVDQARESLARIGRTTVATVAVGLGSLLLVGTLLVIGARSEVVIAGALGAALALMAGILASVRSRGEAARAQQVLAQWELRRRTQRPPTLPSMPPSVPVTFDDVAARLLDRDCAPEVREAVTAAQERVKALRGDIAALDRAIELGTDISAGDRLVGIGQRKRAQIGHLTIEIDALEQALAEGADEDTVTERVIALRAEIEIGTGTPPPAPRRRTPGLARSRRHRDPESV